MAETKKETKAETKKDARVELFIPKGAAHDDQNLFVGVNGVGYLLPKGQTSLVPPEVKAEYERYVKAAQKQDENIDKMLEAAK